MRWKKGGSCINIENEVDAWSRKTGTHASLFRKRSAGRAPHLVSKDPSDPRNVVPRDEETRVCGERSTTPNLPEAHPAPKAWCPLTKEQGLAGSEAPRPPGGRPIWSQRRGAR